MTKKTKWFLLVPTLFLSLGASAAEQIKILTADLKPIANAEVLVGSGLSLKTDATGAIAIPAEWTTAQPLTVRAGGFLPTRFEEVMPTSQDLQIHAIDPINLVQISGETTQFQNIKKDGLIDFGLVFPTMSRRQLMQFSATDLVSPEVDQIRVATQRVDLPSNVTLPEQKETYILPITLKKPAFRAFVKPEGSYTMTALHGQFPMKEVMSEMQNGKTFFDVMNYFTFIDFGQIDLAVQKDNIPNKNIAVNQNIIDGKVSYQAPAFNNDQVLLAVSLVEQNGAYYPTDLKRLDSQEKRDLAVPKLAKNLYFASVLTPKLEKQNALDIENEPVAQFFVNITRELQEHIAFESAEKKNALPGITLAISKAPASAPAEFIGLTQPPTVAGQQLKLTVPQTPASIVPVATYVVLAEIQPIQIGQYRSEKRFRQMEFFAQGWVDHIDLPDLTNVVVNGKKYRWEVMFLGRDAQLPAGDYFLDEITHVSRHAYDF